MPQHPEVGVSEPLSGSEKLPYWHINVPDKKREPKCPEFLRDISDRHKDMISVPSDQYQYQSWEEIKDLIDTDGIDQFRRAPADHRRYLAWRYYLEHAYGSLENFMQNRRLKWTDLTAKGPPFTDPADIKIIYNDWPYGIDSRIVHLCIWTKFVLKDDVNTKRLTPEARQEIDDYVEKVFRSKIPADRVRWFKNWDTLKSIHGMEHFHVLLFDPDTEFIDEITNNDAPLSLVTI